MPFFNIKYYMETKDIIDLLTHISKNIYNAALNILNKSNSNGNKISYLRSRNLTIPKGYKWVYRKKIYINLKDN